VRVIVQFLGCGFRSKERARQRGAQFAGVKVDGETGEVTVLRSIGSIGCGRLLNRMLAHSRLVGGLTQGAGFVLTEERVVDRASGIALNANREEHKLPAVRDVPPIEHPAALPKGAGETPCLPDYPPCWLSQVTVSDSGAAAIGRKLSSMRLVAGPSEWPNPP
jgi:CO/xanthine dehydrogenase Mo-binding subunit